MPLGEFLLRHLPEKPAWQLLEKPLEHGEAMRQALAHAPSRSPPRPATQKPRTEHLTGDKRVWEGLRILKPTRPGAEVRGLPSEVSIFNLQERSVQPCHLEYGGTSTVLSRGSHRIQAFAGTQARSGSARRRV